MRIAQLLIIVMTLSMIILLKDLMLLMRQMTISLLIRDISLIIDTWQVSHNLRQKTKTLVDYIVVVSRDYSLP